MNSKRYRQLPIVVLLMGCIESANAYFDPNTGGILYQILFPVLVAIAATWRFIKMAVVNLFNRLSGRTAKPNPNDPASRNAGSDRLP